MADEDAPNKSSFGLITKVVATIFAGIIAPLTVAIGMKWANKIDAPADADKEQPKAAGLLELK